MTWISMHMDLDMPVHYHAILTYLDLKVNSEFCVWVRTFETPPCIFRSYTEVYFRLNPMFVTHKRAKRRCCTHAVEGCGSNLEKFSQIPWREHLEIVIANLETSAPVRAMGEAPGRTWWSSESLRERRKTLRWWFLSLPHHISSEALERNADQGRHQCKEIKRWLTVTPATDSSWGQKLVPKVSCVCLCLSYLSVFMWGC